MSNLYHKRVANCYSAATISARGVTMVKAPADRRASGFDLLYDARGTRSPMLLKLLALAVVAIPVLLFARTVLLRRPTRYSRNFQQFKRQVDVAVWLLIAIIGTVGAFTLARMAWSWWAGP